MGEIEPHAHAAAPPTRHGRAHRRRRLQVAVAVLVAGIATTPAHAADDPSMSRPAPVPLTASVDLRVDRAPLAVVLGQLAATAGLDRARVEEGETARVTGPLAGSLRAVLAGLVADHALVVDIADGTLDARSRDRRRTRVLDAGPSNRAMPDIAGALATRLPGNIVASTGSTLVVSGHPAFVSRIERQVATSGTTGSAPAADAAARSERPAPNTGRGIDPTSVAAAMPRPDGTAKAARSAAAPEPPAPAIRSIDDVPGFY